MFDHIDPRSPTPLYAQIAHRVRVAIAAGDLTAGDALPSVRQLASELRVNPATVVQAYRELEMEGLVATRHGAGTYVRELAPDRKARERMAEARRLVHEMLAEAGRLGLGLLELREAVEQELGEGAGGRAAREGDGGARERDAAIPRATEHAEDRPIERSVGRTERRGIR